MNYLTNIFNEIEQDFEEKHYKNKESLSRRISSKNGCQYILSLKKYEQTRSVGIKLDEEYNEVLIKKLPKWRGIEQRVASVSENGKKEFFLFFEQLKQYETYIYEIVMFDVISTLSKLTNKELALNKLYDILNKWKRFFQAENDIVMSEIKQQGLYCELVFLEKIINIKGQSAVLCWTGSNSEVHDFYVDGNAIEVKSSSKKAPYFISISSEHQLDSRGVSGKLYLSFNSVKKSIGDGEGLKQIVDRIINKLNDNNSIIDEFKDKLFAYGYLYDYPELNYTLFAIREERYYEVNEHFPKLTTDNTPIGIGNITYNISLDACEKLKITIGNVLNRIKECNE